MAKQPNAYKKFVATAATATLVATALAPVASAAPVDSYKDVSKDYKDAVNYLLENGIAQGTSDTTFGTSNNISRGDAAVMIANALKLDTANAKDQGFQDVNSRVEGAVNAIVEAGIASGRTTAKFDPAAYITRQEMAKMLANAYKLTATEKADFKDVNANWIDYVSALKEAGITLGKTETTFAPTANLTRGEFALFVYRAEEKPANDVVVVDGVTVVNETTTTATLKVANKELTAKDFTVLVNGKEVTPTKVESDAKGEVYTITHASLKDTSGTVSVNGKQAAFNFVVVEPKVESVKAINATEVQVTFTQAVDKTDIAGKATVQGVNFTSEKLSEDGKTLTLSTGTTPIDVKNAAVVVEPIMTKADKLVKTEKFVSLITYKDEVAPSIASVEAKTNGTTATSLTVTVSEPVKSGALAKVDGNYVTINFNNTDTAEVTGLNLEASKAHTIELINLEDLAGNKTVSSSAGFNVSVDTVAPTAVLTTQSDKNILVTFNKPMNEAATLAALGNGKVKDEALADVATGTPTMVADSNNTQFIIPVNTTLFNNKDSRTLNVVLTDAIKDSLGNKLVPTTQKVTLTKDIVKPVATGYEIVKNTAGEVTSLVINFSEGLSANANPVEPTIVDENGVNVTTTILGGLTAQPVLAGDKKVTLTAGTPAKVAGKYAFTFANEFVSDQAEVANKTAAFNYNVDFGQGVTQTEFEVTSAVVTNDASVNLTTPSSNIIKVTFPEVVKGGGVANSATDIANYSLGGKPLPVGTTITLDSDQKVATITLADDSISKDDVASIFTASNIKNTAGTKTLKSYKGTVKVADNIKPVLESAKVLDNQTIELTYSEAIAAFSADTDVKTGFVIKNGSTEAITFASGDTLKANKVSGFDKKITIKLDKDVVDGSTGAAEVNTLTVVNPATAAGDITVTFADGTLNETKTVAVALNDTKEQVAAKIAAAFNGQLTGYAVSTNGANVVFTANTKAADKTVTVTTVDTDTTGVGTPSATQTTAGAAPSSAKATLDILKDITVETKDSAVVTDNSAKKNHQEADVKVTVVK